MHSPFQIDEDLTARVNMADYKFSFHEVGKEFSPAWIAPEALQRKPADINLRAADMWSYSVLLWELATREVPFADMSPMEVGMKVYSMNFHLSSDSSIPFDP